MTFHKTCSFFVAVMVLAFGALPVMCSQIFAQQQSDQRQMMLADPVGAVIIGYLDAVDEFRKQADRSPVTRLAHRREWKERFQKIVAEYPLKEAKYPRDEFVRIAKSNLLSLYNGLEEYDKSQALL